MFYCAINVAGRCWRRIEENKEKAKHLGALLNRREVTIYVLKDCLRVLFLHVLLFDVHVFVILHCSRHGCCTCKSGHAQTA
mmetsp:Transcript_85501/g.134423  ORF Transcript_85501/g.134423 Transcript_85501/m.134423 type:complete len:81 (+) Transcript_85501:422-664(+)